jgi:hypothetical protein
LTGVISFLPAYELSQCDFFFRTRANPYAAGVNTGGYVIRRATASQVYHVRAACLLVGLRLFDSSLAPV